MLLSKRHFLFVPEGNDYISMNGVGPQSFWHGGGTVLESWTPSGDLRWRKLGLTFVDCADADPIANSDALIDVYDKYSRYLLDLRKTTAGTEWRYAGRTLNQIKYPARVVPHEPMTHRRNLLGAGRI